MKQFASFKTHVALFVRSKFVLDVDSGEQVSSTSRVGGVAGMCDACHVPPSHRPTCTIDRPTSIIVTHIYRPQCHVEAILVESVARSFTGGSIHDRTESVLDDHTEAVLSPHGTIPSC